MKFSPGSKNLHFVLVSFSGSWVKNCSLKEQDDEHKQLELVPGFTINIFWHTLVSSYWNCVTFRHSLISEDCRKFISWCEFLRFPFSINLQVQRPVQPNWTASVLHTCSDRNSALTAALLWQDVPIFGPKSYEMSLEITEQFVSFTKVCLLPVSGRTSKAPRSAKRRLWIMFKHTHTDSTAWSHDQQR